MTSDPGTLAMRLEAFLASYDAPEVWCADEPAPWLHTLASDSLTLIRSQAATIEAQAKQIEDLREDSDTMRREQRAFLDALRDLPEVPKVDGLYFIASVAMNTREPDVRALGKEMQHRLNTSEHRVIPYKTELECAAGLWSIIADGIRSRLPATDAMRAADRASLSREQPNIGQVTDTLAGGGKGENPIADEDRARSTATKEGT